MMKNHFTLDAITAPIDTDAGLKHAVLQSIYNHAIATHNDRARMQSAERGGCWSDDYVSNVGSRDWTLSREKITEQTINRSRKFLNDALQWLIDDGFADAVDVAVTRTNDPNKLNRIITITKNNKKLSMAL